MYWNKQEKRDRLGLLEMGQDGYLLTRPRILVSDSADNSNTGFL